MQAAFLISFCILFLDERHIPCYTISNDTKEVLIWIAIMLYILQNRQRLFWP